MDNEKHILISLDPRHAENIFAGSKQVELRRRVMHVEPGTTIWIYAKLPVGSIIGRVKIVSVHASSPTNLWHRFGSRSGLSKHEFFEYFNGVKQGVALVLENAERLHRSMSLAAIRGIDNSFQPPQFFAHLTAPNPILEAVKYLQTYAMAIPVTKILKYESPQVKLLGTWKSKVAYSHELDNTETNTEIENLFCGVSDTTATS